MNKTWNEEKFWDGFQWITKTKAQYEMEQNALLENCNSINRANLHEDEMKRLIM